MKDACFIKFVLIKVFENRLCLGHSPIVQIANHESDLSLVYRSWILTKSSKKHGIFLNHMDLTVNMDE